MILVLGAGGCFAQDFIGRLKKEGREVIGIGRSRKTEAFAPHRYFLGHLVEDFEQILEIIGLYKVKTVVNFAAQGEGAASFKENAPDFFRTNTWGLSRLAWEFFKRDLRFIQIGTSEVYGSVDRPAREEEGHKNSSPYAISKEAFDDYVLLLARQGFQVSVIRPSNCYVEGQQLHRIIPKAIVHALTGRKVPLHGGGKSRKSYLHAEDLSSAILSVLGKGEAGQVYNCGPELPISIKELTQRVGAVCGVESLTEDVGERFGQDGCYWLDSSKLRSLGWQPKVDLDSGLGRMLRWVESYPELLSMSCEYVHKQ